MKAVFILNRKTGELDSFVYHGPGEVPPFVPPENRDEPRDYVPAKAGQRSKKRKKERPA